MLKVVVFDSGYGGELFADYLGEEIPTLEIVRVIDWRNAEALQENAKKARKVAEEALRPHIYKADLIVIANYLVSATSLNYFKRKYKNQKFVGINFTASEIAKNRQTIMLSTKALTRTLAYKLYTKKNNIKSFALDDWPILIDDGELGNAKLHRDLKEAKSLKPSQIILACGQFTDLKPEFRRFFGHNTKIIDNFDTTLHDVIISLKLRGALKKKD